MSEHNSSYRTWADEDVRSSITFLTDELKRVDEGRSAAQAQDPSYRDRVVRDLNAARAELVARQVHPGRIVAQSERTFEDVSPVTIRIERIVVHPLADDSLLTAWRVTVESARGTWPVLLGSRAEVEAFLNGLKAWAAVSQLKYPSIPEIP